MENKPNRIIWHHSADVSKAKQALKINEYHRTQNFPKSSLGFFGGYHILIEKDGEIVRYREDNEIGAHDKDENINSLGVCLAGNFSVEMPTPQQVNSLKTQLTKWIIDYNISIDRIDPHRMGDATECPGKLLDDEWARNLIRKEKSEDIQMTLEDIIEYIRSKM